MVSTLPDANALKVVTISDNHDLILRVTEYTKKLGASDDGHDKIKAVADFQVNRQFLIDNAESGFFRTLLTTRNFAEAGKNFIKLDEHNPSGVEVILCAVHSKDENWKSSAIGQAVTARTLQLPAQNLWDVVTSNQFMMMQFFHLDNWFVRWYARNSHATPNEMLLYPCLQFHHAVAFMQVTKALVYECAYIVEFRSKNHHDKHIEPRVLHALNSARGHLRVLLSNWLFKKVKAMMEVSCDCKEKTVYQYIKALVETKGYPIDEQNRKSINEVCKNLATFPVHFKLPESSKSCSTCNSDWGYIVSSAIDSIKKHFDGLCLDCMDHTQPQFLDEHWDYWNHLSSGRQWDRNCRVKHSQSTWYSSFMGRADTRDHILRRARHVFDGVRF
ncbi:hypothetical protein D6C91_03717 [Aureobasidium pullulans]|uniref:Uncharacterized protein n=1 Tax=Aureobasidium pullulans TaxID=5580 RepID=A0A4S9TGX3_AURPU|nr:hypothetical protein D6C91_03717 [Aureobasidium pullulans]